MSASIDVTSARASNSVMLIFGDGLSDNRVVLFEMPPHLQQKQQLRASAIFQPVHLEPPLPIILLQRLSGPPLPVRLIRSRRPAQAIHQSVMRTCDSPHLHRRLQAMRRMTSSFPCTSTRGEIEVITGRRPMFISKRQLFHERRDTGGACSLIRLTDTSSPATTTQSLTLPSLVGRYSRFTCVER